LALEKSVHTISSWISVHLWFSALDFILAYLGSHSRKHQQPVASMQTLVLLSIAVMARAALAVDYVRPINQDCLSLPSGDVSLFPTEFMITGEVIPMDSYTEVRFRILL